MLAKDIEKSFLMIYGDRLGAFGESLAMRPHLPFCAVFGIDQAHLGSSFLELPAWRLKLPLSPTALDAASRAAWFALYAHGAQNKAWLRIGFDDPFAPANLAGFPSAGGFARAVPARWAQSGAPGFPAVR